MSGATVVAIILIVIIIGQMIINSILLDQIEKDREQNRKYYAKLRREYDRRIAELRDELSIKEDMYYAG